MKKRLLSLAILLVFLFAGVASAASYTSTFNLTETDFALTGFSAQETTGGSYTIPTNGPDTLVLTDPSGSYNLNLPTAPGNYDWYVDIEELDVYFGPYTPDLTLSGVGPVYIGNYPTPDAWSGTYHVGDYDVPSFTYDGTTFPAFTLEGVDVGWDIEFTGTDITKMTMTLDADNLGTTLNALLTSLDYADPDNQDYKNGSIDGHVTGNFSITAVDPVPEPATIVLLGAGLLGLIGYSRKRK